MKRYKQLDKRLAAIADTVREGAVVCDVGTDHAYLPCFLARAGRYGQIYACDLNPKPLEFARAQITHQMADVTLIQSDGVADVPLAAHVDSDIDIIVAGMGGELIAEIVAAIPREILTATSGLRLILQPMTRAEHLRRGLAESGFGVISEKIVRENNRDFIIIHAQYGEVQS